MSKPSQLDDTGRLGLSVTRLCVCTFVFSVYVLDG